MIARPPSEIPSAWTAFAHHHQLVIDLLNARDFAGQLLGFDLLLAVFHFALQSDDAVLYFDLHRATLYYLVVGQLAPDQVVDLIVGNVLIRGPNDPRKRQNDEQGN